MNKAITDGLVLMPPAFSAGLDVWSSEDGTPGSATYDGAANAAIVTADQDFGSCLELAKTDSVQQLRYMGQTPILPGCYLQVTARVKAISGNLPNIRIAAWAGDGSEVEVTGLVTTGPEATLTAYGEVVEVTAIIGTGARGGVDMPWGTEPVYGHIGLDMTGDNGGVVRIDDLEIEDVTSYFLRDMIDLVDVRDHGAVGDGVTDDSAAFEAADADAYASGRGVLVPEGTYLLSSSVTFEANVRFVGTVTMPTDERLTLTQNYDLPSYIDAFGSELEGFRRAVGVLFNSSEHESLDMKGRRVEIDEPIDMHSWAATDRHTIRRVIRNGQISAVASSNWDSAVVTSAATYSASSPLTLSNVADVANIEVGSLVQGLGVGREVYVTSKNTGASSVTLSQPLFDAVGTQTYTFTRFRYMLDFTGFEYLSKFVLSDIDLNCDGEASAVILPPEGIVFHVRDCFFTKPKDRGITSHGRGCQGMLVDRCQFFSNEGTERSQDRTTIAVNSNANDNKIRDNRVVRFAHFGIWGGSGHLFSGNHFFQGDDQSDGIRQAGLILTRTNAKTSVVGNYIDNSFIEWTNEHDEAPEQSSEFSFGGLTVTGNIFTANDVANWFSFFIVKPMGPDHYLHGFTLSHNVFKSLNGDIDRVDKVDTTYAELDWNRARNITVTGNTFTSVDQFIANPMTLQFDEASPSSTWVCSFADWLPFGARARNLVGLTTEKEITNSSGETVWAQPYAEVEEGTNLDEVHLHWPEACEGRVHLTVRIDNLR